MGQLAPGSGPSLRQVCGQASSGSKLGWALRLEEERKERGLLCFREESYHQAGKPLRFTGRRFWVLLAFSDGTQSRIPNNMRDIIVSESKGYSDSKERTLRTLGISWTDDFFSFLF